MRRRARSWKTTMRMTIVSKSESRLTSCGVVYGGENWQDGWLLLFYRPIWLVWVLLACLRSLGGLSRRELSFRGCVSHASSLLLRSGGRGGRIRIPVEIKFGGPRGMDNHAWWSYMHVCINQRRRDFVQLKS